MRARIAQRSNFFGECRAEFPDPGARMVVFIPSHLFHPLHLCPPRDWLRADHG